MKTNLIKPLVVIALVAIIIGGLSQSSFAKKKKDIGLQMYSLRDDLNKDVKGTIEKMGKIGYTSMEAASFDNGKFYGMEPEAFKALLEANGMKLVSSHTGANYTGDQASWDAAMIWWDMAIAAHKKAGCKYIVKPSMGEYPYKNLESLKKTCEYFNAIGEKCNAAGIRFGYHNHNKEFTKITDADDLVYDYMVKNTDPKKVTFELDVYWIYKGGQNAVAYFNKYPKRFELLHIKDEKEIGASGLIDFKPIYENKAKAGTKVCFVEVERYDFEPFVSVQKSFDFLNNASYVK
ncbi:MAG TPA: sugar phosphate isomerase/epimerase [Prolixibacteraceae bacterium]|nr:sugar phosphate isomerase/epimerase [Prolixibacteraceae bacterium]